MRLLVVGVLAAALSVLLTVTLLLGYRTDRPTRCELPPYREASKTA